MPPTKNKLKAADRREIIEQAATELFAERGYRGASMDEIAKRSGVSVPVVYDHFPSKLELHKRLLERHYADLRTLWRESLPGDDPPEKRVVRSVDAWFAYVESHPFAWAMLFRDTSGEPEVEAMQRAVAADHRKAILPMMWEEPLLETMSGGEDPEKEMAWEITRSALQGLAMWWHDHQDVPRERVVATAMNTLWLGFERIMRGEVWRPDQEADHGVTDDS